MTLLNKLDVLCQKSTSLDEYPFATGVSHNVLFYQADSLRQQDPQSVQKIQSELSHALLKGPGVYVIKQAFKPRVIDRFNELLFSLIESEHAEGIGQGDHFAQSGHNARLWNALQKVCLKNPALFADYYSNEMLALIAMSWLGPGYQVTSQVNVVKPGGQAQSPHRDYHLGFMSSDQAKAYPQHVQTMAPFLTLQAAVAHCDMPLSSGPTLLLPYSHQLEEGYMRISDNDLQDYVRAHFIQCPLDKGDLLVFNPALFHAAGTNTTTNINRVANLLQISSAFGRAMESVDRLAMMKSLYPILLHGNYSKIESQNAIKACAEGYAFPTNLDSDPPENGLAPSSSQALMSSALSLQMPLSDFMSQCDVWYKKRQP